MEDKMKNSDGGQTKPSNRKVLKRMCSPRDLGQKFLCFLPILRATWNYKWRKFLVGDILGGVSAASLHLPQGLAFGLLASLTPAVGLYTGFFPVAFYMLFGNSQHVSFGTNAVIAILTAQLTLAEAARFSAEHPASFSNASTDALADLSSPEVLEAKIRIATGASLIVGVTLTLMSLLRLGIVTSYMPASFIHSFVCASAIHITSSQLPRAIGVSVPPASGIGKLIKLYINIFKNITDANVASIIVTIITMVILILVKDCINEKYKHKMKMPVPIDLIIIILATIVSHFARFHDNFGISIVGDIPRGLPSPQLPNITSDIIADSIVIAILIFVLTISMVRTCEDRHGYEVNDNQELLAYGLSNLASSFFHCFPACTAPPRTMILSSLGAKTTLNGIFTMVFMLLVLLAVGPLFSDVPHPVLSAMVIVAVKNLVLHVLDIPKFWRNNRYDFVIWVTTFVGGVFLDVPYALYFGVLVSFFTVIAQSQISFKRSMTHMTQEKIKEKDKYIKEGIKVFKINTALYFATSRMFRKALTSKFVAHEKSSSEDGKNLAFIELQSTDQLAIVAPLKYIILECSSVTYMDINGMNVLAEVIKFFTEKDIQVLLANCTEAVNDKLGNEVLALLYGKDHVFDSVEMAVAYCRNQGHSGNHLCHHL